MNSQTSVINPSGDFEEAIQRYAKHLGRDKNRRAVFDLLYGRGSKPRSKKQIAHALGVGGTAQIVQNALDELAKHHLIVRQANEGQVKDGSRWVYCKESFVRANRDKIVRYADDPAAAKKIATKRTPRLPAGVSFVVQSPRSRSRGPAVARATLRRSGVQLKIALLVTNPDYRASLQTGIEARDIDAAVKLGGMPEKVDIKIFPAPTFDTLVDMLNTYGPDILHFSGHGGGQSLVFDDVKAGDDGGTILDFGMVGRLVESARYRPKLLVLAACGTAEGADQFLRVIPAVIAMKDSIGDEAACEFSSRFYRSVTSGASIRSSLSQAKEALLHKGYADADLPELIVASEAAADRSFVT
jgi:hypothetical protein